MLTALVDPKLPLSVLPFSLCPLGLVSTMRPRWSLPTLEVLSPGASPEYILSWFSSRFKGTPQGPQSFLCSSWASWCHCVLAQVRHLPSPMALSLEAYNFPWQSAWKNVLLVLLLQVHWQNHTLGNTCFEPWKIQSKKQQAKPCPDFWVREMVR